MCCLLLCSLACLIIFRKQDRLGDGCMFPLLPTIFRSIFWKVQVNTKSTSLEPPCNVRGIVAGTPPLWIICSKLTGFCETLRNLQIFAMVLSSKCMFEMDTGISVGIFLTVLLFDVQTSLGHITSFHAYYVPQIQALWVSTFFSARNVLQNIPHHEAQTEIFVGNRNAGWIQSQLACIWFLFRQCAHIFYKCSKASLTCQLTIIAATSLQGCSTFGTACYAAMLTLLFNHQNV